MGHSEHVQIPVPPLLGHEAQPQDQRPSPGLGGSARTNTCSPGQLDSQAFLNPPYRSTHISQHLLSQCHHTSDLCTHLTTITWCQTSPVNDLNSIWQTGLQGSSSLLKALGLSEAG
ncbi:unnamed protein product [Rangifer tarandus platyrhynchus]|uniref:Uncharacterized protein n=1 Tax=Rangifer tarandus platyrhynchus TaxID=3082113 RepID=A0ABN9A4Z2_RANTA|nr:unnamed protein product [Rangifer tarandus platyrhynchus]